MPNRTKECDLHKQTGFSIIELMITIGVVGVLASIAIPAYTSYLERSRTAEAKTNVTTLAMLLEQHQAIYGWYCKDCNVAGANTYDYTENNDGSVDTDEVTSWLRFKPKQATDGAATRYNYSITANQGLSYTITATPVADRGAPPGLVDGAFTLDQDGVKTYDTNDGWKR